MGILKKEEAARAASVPFQKDCAQDKRVSPRRARPEQAIPPAKEFHHGMHPVHPQRLLRCIRSAAFGSPPFRSSNLESISLQQAVYTLPSGLCQGNTTAAKRVLFILTIDRVMLNCLHYQCFICNLHRGHWR